MSLRRINRTKKYLLKKDNAMVSGTNDGKGYNIAVGFSESHKSKSITIYHGV